METINTSEKSKKNKSKENKRNTENIENIFTKKTKKNSGSVLVKIGKKIKLTAEEFEIISSGWQRSI